MFEATISLADSESLLSLFGARDQHIRRVREALEVDISHQDGEIRIVGPQEAVAMATETLEQLQRLAERAGELTPDDVGRVLAQVTGQDGVPPEQAPVSVMATGRTIRPLTPGQARYLKAIQQCDLTFCVGPSGTGKTYLAVASAIEAFIILDEAQNTTVAQMKMFLTRMGAGSKIVVAGDVTQIDLPPHTRSGMNDALTRLKNINGFRSLELSKNDIVRHRLVQDIVRAYEEGTKRRRPNARR